MGEWQPIETIPADDTPKLIYMNGGGIVIAAGVAPELSRSERLALLKETGVWPDYSRYRPTHWMPLPKPPEAA